jgi:biopolymer transport protein ExbB
MLTYPLAAVAGLSPLLGLFGTVLGMIESFEMVAIAGSMGDPALLASGISKALVTTAFGLFVAIPTLFFYHLFKLRTNYLAKLLEEEASTLMSEWLMQEDRHAD